MTSRLTESARGKPCTLQLPLVCSGNPEQTVLCHLPSSAKGMAIKSPDWWGVYGCLACHDALDGRSGVKVGSDELLRALYLTWSLMIRDGVIEI